MRYDDQMRRFTAFPVLVALLGCTASGGHAPADGDAGGDASTDTPDVATCSTPIAGSAPFGVHLEGERAGADARVIQGAVDVYFPHGRVAGAEVVFVVAGGFGPEFHHYLARTTLDATLSARFSITTGTCPDSVVGTLVGPTGGIVADVSEDLSAPSDGVVLETARVTLCPSGALPAPHFTGPSGSTIGPLEGFTIEGNVPLDVESLAAVHAVPLRGLRVVEALFARVSVDPAGTFPPFERTVIEFGGLRDVLGRALDLPSSSIATRFLTTSIVDRSFSTAPPAGAVQGGSATTSGGVLRLGENGSGASALLGLGDRGAATHLRLRRRAICGADTNGRAPLLTLIGEDGAIAHPTVACGDAPVDTVVKLGSAARWALAVADDYQLPWPPCWYGPPPPDTRKPPAYELDELAFEP
jgi:hypothetical protein